MRHLRSLVRENVCKTPGAVYHFDIKPSTIGVSIDLPRPIELSEDEASKIEDDLHDAVEGVLAHLFEEEIS